MNTVSKEMTLQHRTIPPGEVAFRVGLDWRPLLVVVGATAAMALGFGGLALTSVFIRPLEAAFAWSRAEISFAYGVATIGAALGGLFWGRVSDRIDIRVLLAIGAAGMVLPLLAMAAVQSLWQMYLSNLILGGVGFAVLYGPVLSATGEWFDRRRGLAIGIVTAGGALGQGVLPFIANGLIDHIGWRVAFVAVAIGMLIVLALTLPGITRPDRAKPSTGPAPQPAAMIPRRERGELLTLSIAAFLCCVCMGVPLVHMASYVGMICGSPAIGATSLLVAMMFGAVGRVFFGTIGDRIGFLPSYALASVMQTVCVVGYPLLGDSMSLMVLSAVFGFGFAGNMTCLILCVREAVPAHRFGSAFGFVALIAWAGMGAGGYLGGVMFDVYRSYAGAFGLAGLAGVLNLLAIGALIVMRRNAGSRLVVRF